jgi:DinB superfamily
MSDSSRAAELAARFEGVHGEVMTVAESCEEPRWSMVCPGEEWPIGVVLSHIAEAYAAVDGWIGGYLEGRPVPQTRALIEEGNAHHAVAAAAVPREETLAKLRANGGRVVATIGALTDEQLAISLPMELAGGSEVSAERLVEIVCRHTCGHLDSVRQAVAV